jgi:hypothetical protein
MNRRGNWEQVDWSGRLVKVDATLLPLSTRVTLFSHASCARKLKCVLVVAVLVCARLLERKFPPSRLPIFL